MSNVRILIVDDDKEFLALLCKSIESWGGIRQFRLPAEKKRWR